MHTYLKIFTISCFSLLLALGCSDDSGTTGQQDSGVMADGATAADQAAPATAAFKSLKAYSSIKGKASLEATVTGAPTKLELLADGKVVASLTAAPWTFSWDTSSLADALVKLSLKATDGQGSKTSTETAVVLLNKGSAISWKAGSSAEIIVPASGYVDQHLRYHWDMPSGVTKIIAILDWEKTGFSLELALGMGVCPDSGTVAVKKVSETSPLPATYPESGSSALKDGQWFAHVQLMNSTKVLGKSTKFRVYGYLLK